MKYIKAFDQFEYKARLTRVKKIMNEKGFDMLICQDPANMCWLTGFDGWSFYTPQTVIVHLNEDWPIWFGREQDAKSANITTDIPQENIISFSEPLVHHETLHPFDELCDYIKHRKWEKNRIGVDFDAHYFTARAYKHLYTGLPNAKISDNKELVNWARLIKSPKELTYMREAGNISTNTMLKAIDQIVPGVPEYKIIADIYKNQIEGIQGKYGDYTGLCPLIQVGEKTSTPHLTWSEEPLPKEGLVVLEIGSARRHYHAPLTRTIYIGKVPSEVSNLASTIVDAGNKAFEVARPGITCAEVESTWQKELNKRGFEKKSRVGYSIGLNFPPDWGERTASLRVGDKTILKEGMCFHFQSGIWLDNFGAAISESIVIGKNGIERLCNVDRKLFEVI
ncbi:MAG: Ectoine hydrolase [Alphaproteobacteria bacterium MarineAlpha5_Bin5]|nr:MAG: Ectoine hydrolase [Alphaproteobacteria bacterium MarineAlpha5_Bin5]|tara:strand:+ start:1349 stop:2530 length:1182 start_codon:yes stop_codon:yes gene_type:complete